MLRCCGGGEKGAVSDKQSATPPQIPPKPPPRTLPHPKIWGLEPPRVQGSPQNPPRWGKRGVGSLCPRSGGPCDPPRWGRGLGWGRGTHSIMGNPGLCNPHLQREGSRKGWGTPKETRTPPKGSKAPSPIVQDPSKSASLVKQMLIKLWMGVIPATLRNLPADPHQWFLLGTAPPEISANHSARRCPSHPPREFQPISTRETAPHPLQESQSESGPPLPRPCPLGGPRGGASQSHAAGAAGTGGNRRRRSPVGAGPGCDWSLTACGRSAARTRRRRAAVNAAAMMLPPMLA